MIQPNTFRARLDAGKPTLGTHFLAADPDIPELIGDIGLFDYAEYSGEYSTFDMALLYHLARAAQCGNLPLMIKLDQEGQGFWAQAALGAGFASVLFTDIRTPGDIIECHRVIRARHAGSRWRDGREAAAPGTEVLRARQLPRRPGIGGLHGDAGEGVSGGRARRGAGHGA